ncbi:MAG TPA: hypothetical protein V6C78_06795 [Crinalium sp.]|jgi:hypothetical protein
MIHHISIAVENPARVAQALGELLNAEVAPFPPCPGSYIIIPFDEHGTAIEVYPAGIELVPGHGDDQVQFVQNPNPSRYISVHAAISVPVSQAKVEEVAAREGWRAVLCDRDGFFEVIEVWVENRIMLELLPPVLAARYLEFTRPHNARQFIETATPVGV